MNWVLFDKGGRLTQKKIEHFFKKKNRAPLPIFHNLLIDQMSFFRDQTSERKKPFL